MHESAFLSMRKNEGVYAESTLPIMPDCNGPTLKMSIMEHEPGHMYLDISHVIVHSRDVYGRTDQCTQMDSSRRCRFIFGDVTPKPRALL